MLSDRDVFAMAAMPAIYGDLMQNAYEDLDFDNVARMAYRQADSMLRERGKAQRLIGWANRYESGEIGSIYPERENVPNLPDVKEVVAIYVAPDYDSTQSKTAGEPDS